MPPPAGAVRSSQSAAPAPGFRPTRRPRGAFGGLAGPIGDAVPSLAEALPADLSVEEAERRLVAVAARLVGDGPPDSAVQTAARLLADPSARLPAVTDRLGISERHLRRRFHESVGYGPKTLQRVLRLRRFLDVAASGPPDLAGLAAAAGFADQAHLTRECRELTGAMPTVLSRLVGEPAGPRRRFM